jgi:O-antigen ligase
LDVAVRRIGFAVVLFTFIAANSVWYGLTEIFWYSKFILLILLGAYLFLASRKTAWRSQRVTQDVKILLCWFFVAAIFSTYIGVEQSTADRYAFSVVYSISLLFGFFIVLFTAFYLALFLDEIKNQNTLLSGLMICAQLVIYSNLVLAVSGISLGRGSAYRFSGWFDNPNTLGAVLLGLMPVLLYKILKRKHFHILSQDLFLLLAGLYLTYQTGSRASIVGLAFMMAILLWFHSTRARYTSILLGFFLTVSVLGQGLVLEPLARSSVDILSGRSEVWAIGWDLLLENPWFGHGFGSEQGLIEANLSFLAEHQGASFHNSYLTLLVSCGFMGATVMFLFLFLAIVKVVRSSFRSSDFNRLTAAWVAGFLVHGYAETWIFSAGNAYGVLFWASVWRIHLWKVKTKSSHRVNQSKRSDHGNGGEVNHIEI